MDDRFDQANYFYRTLAILVLAMTSEVSNTYLFAFTLMDIAREFKLTWAATALLGFGPLISAVIGGQLIGLISDIRGRRTGLAASLFLSAAGAVATGLSTSIWTLAMARMAAGVTLAGTWTACTALINETAPEDMRGRSTAAVQSGFPLGNLLCSAIVVLLMNSWGWRSNFWGLGLILFACGLLVVFWVPESRIWSENKLSKTHENNQKSRILREIFSPPYRRSTVIAIVISILTVFGGFSIHTGIPSIILNIGFPVEEVPKWSAFVWGAAAVGYSSFGFIADRFGRKRIFLFFLISTFAICLLLGTAVPYLQGLGKDIMASYLGICFLAFIMYFTGFYSGIGVLYSSMFPVRIRATAIGLTFNAGRIGSAVSPFILQLLFTEAGFGAGLILSTLPLLAAGMVGLKFLIQGEGELKEALDR